MKGGGRWCWRGGEAPRFFFGPRVLSYTFMWSSDRCDVCVSVVLVAGIAKLSYASVSLHVELCLLIKGDAATH